MSSFLKKKICLVFFLFLSICQGCATTEKSVTTGALVGGAVGATAGALADPGQGGSNRFRNVMIGTAIGGALGAGTGLLIDSGTKDEKKSSYEKGKRDAAQEISAHPQGPSGAQPMLVPAKTEARWMPDQVHGSTFVPAHFEYQILENAHWEASQ